MTVVDDYMALISPTESYEHTVDILSKDTRGMPFFGFGIFLKFKNGWLSEVSLGIHRVPYGGKIWISIRANDEYQAQLIHSLEFLRGFASRGLKFTVRSSLYIICSSTTVLNWKLEYFLSFSSFLYSRYSSVCFCFLIWSLIAAHHLKDFKNLSHWWGF